MNTLNDIAVGDTGMELVSSLNGNNTILQTAIDTIELKTPNRGNRLLLIGDSITGQNTYPLTVAAIKELTIVSNMGIGGSRIIPNIKDLDGQRITQSIYYRADLVAAQTPDIIFLLGGQNDFNYGGDVVYDLSEDAYTGDELNDGDENMPTFVEAYKGVLLKLVSQNIAARVYAGCPMYSWNQPSTYLIQQRYIAIRDAIKKMCEYYGVIFIDTLIGSQINAYNSSSLFMPDGVHPNSAGGVRIGQYIASKII